MGHGKGQDRPQDIICRSSRLVVLSPARCCPVPSDQTQRHSDVGFAPSRPKFRAGYFQLLKYLAFIGLYFAILTIQMKVDDVFQIDEVGLNFILIVCCLH